MTCEDNHAVSDTDLDTFFNKFNFNFVISNPREPDNPIIYASEGFFRVTGYGPKDILNRNCRILQGPGTSPQAISEIRDAIREERSTSVCLLNFRKDGSPFWNAFSLSPIKNAAGLVEYYIGIQADVTPLVVDGAVGADAVRSVAQDELRKAERIAQNIQKHSDVLLCHCNSTCAVDSSVPSSLLTGLSGITGSFVLSDPRLPDNPMVYCSPAFLKLTGYKCHELVGRNCRLLQGPGTDPEAVQRIRDGVAAKRPVTVSLINYKNDGTPFQNCIHIAPIRDADGQVQFYCGVQVALGELRSSGRAVAVSEESMLVAPDEATPTAAEALERLEPTGMQLLQQKGVVGAVRVAARSLSVHGLRRAEGDQARPGEATLPR